MDEENNKLDSSQLLASESDISKPLIILAGPGIHFFLYFFFFFTI
jgi:hypothetical protein